MKNNEIDLNKTVISILDEAADNKWLVTLDFNNGLFRDYCDASGQRRAYLEHFSYKLDNVKFPGSVTYIVRRKLSFTNDVDKGTEGAILGTLIVDNRKYNSLKIESFEDGYLIKLDSCKIRILKN